MHIHFLGIGGTLMGSLALLAQSRGDHVTGSDTELYPPMSDQLADAGIAVHIGWDDAQWATHPDLVVVGNAGLHRGNPAIEYILSNRLRFVSGAQWLGEDLLRDRWVIAVSGTHGKTTTTAMVAWILQQAGKAPGWLIGGVPQNLHASSSLGDGEFFVVEADEYDTSYFDRRAKFVHYYPRTLIINNLEYDHADIYADLDAIRYQFHLLLRCVPENGLIIAPAEGDAIEQLFSEGCWTPTERLKIQQRNASMRNTRAVARNTGRWSAADIDADGSGFSVLDNGEAIGKVQWTLMGQHNVSNALAAIAATVHTGVDPVTAIAALSEFQGVKRRMEVIARSDDMTLYDDFAHHPTAIRTTLQGLRAKVKGDEIIAIIEPRSHTMAMGTLEDELATCTSAADRVIWRRTEKLKWDLNTLSQDPLTPTNIEERIEAIIQRLVDLDAPVRHRHIVIMSNGSFDGIHKQLADALGALPAG